LNILKIFIFIFLWFSYTNCHSKKDASLNLESLIPLLNQPQTKFYFAYPGRDTPEESKNKIRKKLIEHINNANIEIVGYIYGLNDLDVILALRSAKQRRVKIFLQGDKDETYDLLESYGIPLVRWNGSGIHHTKIWIFDKTKSFWGTGNYTTSGLLRDNNVFWEEKLNNDEYTKLIAILRQEDELGILNLENSQILFSPEAGYMIQNQLLSAVRNAKSNIRFMIFTHYDPLLTFELVRACKRGVKVIGIYNGSPFNEEGKILANVLPSPCSILTDGNFDTEFNGSSYTGGILHHKTMIIDESKVLVGSYNFTVSARDDNREFFLEFTDQNSIREFIGEWNRIFAVAQDVESTENLEVSENKFYLTETQNFLGILSGYAKGESIEFDKNSSGLMKEINASTSYLDSLPESELNSFNSMRSSYANFTLPNTFSWMISELKPVEHFSVLTLWDRIKINIIPKIEINNIITWDGKKIPKVWNPIEGTDFPIQLLTTIKSESWIVFNTKKGYLFSCSKKSNSKISKWIRYLHQLQIQNGFKEKECLVF